MSQKYTNSPLVVYTNLSPNNSGTRTHEIDRITPHCVVGQLSVESLGKIFENPDRNASSNYGIGADGRVGMYVEEKNRSWCSSSPANDQRAITIECACDKNKPYTFTTTVYYRLVDLCVDICKRYNKTKVVWINDKTEALKYQCKSNEMLLTVHRWFANTSCPGEWLYTRMANLRDLINQRLEVAIPNDKYNIIYRVQLGAYSVKANAERMLTKAKKAGFTDAFIKTENSMYKVQVGAYSIYENAVNQLDKCKNAGFKDAFISKTVTPVPNKIEN